MITHFILRSLFIVFAVRRTVSMSESAGESTSLYYKTNKAGKHYISVAAYPHPFIN